MLPLSHVPGIGASLRIFCGWNGNGHLKLVANSHTHPPESSGERMISGCGTGFRIALAKCRMQLKGTQEFNARMHILHKDEDGSNGVFQLIFVLAER
jgi:hypothetical protein